MPEQIPSSRDDREARKREIEAEANSLADKLNQLQEEMNGLVAMDESHPNDCPPQVRHALDTLRVVYRSMRMEHVSVSKRLKSPDGTWEEASEEHKSEARCRTLRRTEAVLVDTCCRAISSYISEFAPDTED